jgi:hypothetical protein
MQRAASEKWRRNYHDKRTTTTLEPRKDSTLADDHTDKGKDPKTDVDLDLDPEP